jgi:hypothetical protein
MGRTATAIGCALMSLAGCGGETTAAAPRATSDRASDAPPATPGTGSGPGAVPDAQSDAALEPARPDSAAAFTGPAACAAAGGQCEVARCSFESPVPCGPGAVCCIDTLCAADASAPIIQASDYDQSCAVESDCAEVLVGNGCTCEISCGTPGAINMSALPQYTADFAKFPHVFCNCPPPPPPPCTNKTYAGPGPHCIDGICQITPCRG